MKTPLLLFFKLIILSLLVSFINIGDKNSTNRDYSSEELINISIFKNNVEKVVNVSTIIQRSGSFFMDENRIPAGAGTGFIWDTDGHIVTNYHVVQNGNQFIISFHNDKNSYRAKIIGVEPKKDIAVLKLEKRPAKLSNIQLGDSKGLNVGQKTFAIGNPFGLDHTMTTGIVSAVGRKVEGIGGVKIHDMIQTDAAINPGNSGGPLLDSKGRLIGMNTQILSGSGTSSGVGFAVPVNTIKRIVPQIIKHGKVIRPGLGISLLPDHIKFRFGIEDGLVISTVGDGSAAEKAGLQGVTQDKWGRVYIGDIILKIGDTLVNSYDDIYHALDKYKVGDKVKIEYLREDKVKTLTLKLDPI